jgi:hypothetical protein
MMKMEILKKKLKLFIFNEDMWENNIINYFW